MNTTLPIGVVIPVLNCKPELPAHLEGSASWLPLVEQVVVVDSFSTDGTLDYLKAELKHPHAEFGSHPPGLYQSWNEGISKIRSKYLYVSTVGDLITAETLTNFCNIAERFQADVVLSPSVFVSQSGQPMPELKWPINEIIDAWAIKEPRPVDSAELLALAIFYSIAGGLKSILGSSASSLYRTATFQKHPFPTDYTVIGDTVWGLRHTPDVKYAIAPAYGSKFVVVDRPVTEKVRARNATYLERLHAEVNQILARDKVLNVPDWPRKRAVLQQMYEAYQGFTQTRLQLEAFRKATFPWVLRPDAWKLRLQRKRHRENFQRLSQQMLPGSKARLLDFVVK